MPSILRDWVTQLPLREQGTLLTAIRGCDLTPKFPLDAPERQLVAAIRYAVLNPADEREVGLPGAFMQRGVPVDTFKYSSLGHLPHHYVMHLLHAVEVLAYRDPRINSTAAVSLNDEWMAIYLRMCHGMHVPPETENQMYERLSEDRIASGTVSVTP